MRLNLCPFCFQPFTGYSLCPHCGQTVGESRSGAQQLPLGTILDGKYQLGMVLGQGGFGITYLAYDLTLRVRGAIKEYFPLGLVTRQGQTVTFTGGNAQPFFQKGVEAFYREAQLLARFQTHQNIVHVSSFFRQNSTAYFVMEYVEGESLSAYLDRCGGRLSYEETVRLLTPILEALSDVHNAGILHRDIAPDNICLTKDGNVKLLDFGAAKNELSIHTHSSAAILKPGYAPMEQYTAGSNQGPWTDIYAMGAVIYRCLTGNVPPDAPDRIIGQPLLSFKEANVSAPAGAETAIDKALALDIQNRWQRVADFRNALIDPSALKNVRPRSQKQEKSQKQKPRKPWLISVLIIAALFLIASVIISQTILPKERVYREGTMLIAEGKYEDAILMLSDISSYRDSESQIRRAKSLQAEEFLALDNYEKAEALFTELSGEEYALERIEQRKEEYEQLHPSTPDPRVEIKPTEELPTPTQNPVPVQTELQKRLATANSGDIITIGRYEQDGNEENGPEDIEWVVLDKSNNHIFIVSRYGLVYMSMNLFACSRASNTNNCQWENTTIREWLNSDFIMKNFNEDEREIIEATYLEPVENSIFGIKADNHTVDKIFLLSIEEVEKFFPDKNQRVLSGTNKTNFDNIGNWWWLRSPGSNHTGAYDATSPYGSYHHDATNEAQNCTYVAFNGELDVAGFACDGRGLIRPAMRIKLSSIEEIQENPIDNSVLDSIELETLNNYFPIFEQKQVGDIIQFGVYEQDGDVTNGKEPIDWIVLDKQDDRMLLLSKFILDTQSYHRKNESVTWEKCNLRNWLNNDFITTAFIEQEQSLLQETIISTPDFDAGITTSSDGKELLYNLYLDGSVVTDRCFVLDYEEIETYLKEHERKTVSSDYSKNKNFTNFDYWYIRSGNCNQIQHYRDYNADLFFSPVITGDGKLASVVSQTQKGVRPAIWVKISN